MEEAAPFDDSAFRRLASFSPDSLIAHRDGLIIWANEATARLLGFDSATHIEGRTVLSFIAPESLERAHQRLARLLDTGQPEPRDEFFLISARGERVLTEVSTSAAGGGLMVTSVRDLRERQRVEARARAVFEVSSEAMGVCREGNHVEVNAAFARLFGYDSPAELVGVPVVDLVEPSEHSRITWLMQRRERGEATPSNYLAKARRRDGSKLLIEVQASSYREADAHTSVVVMRDVTAQHEFENRLAASEHRLRQLCHQMPVGVWEVDLSETRRTVDALRARGVTDCGAHFRDHHEDTLRCLGAIAILSANQAACEQAGVKDEAELLGSMYRFIPPESVADVTQIFAEFAAGVKVVTTETWARTRSGERRWVSMRATAISGHEQDWARVLVTTTDLTERKKAREEKDHLQEQLRHKEKLEAIGRLAGGVAHDFNNLLAAILSSVEVSLDDPTAGPPVRESLTLIREASLRAKDLVQQILTFGRKDKPKLVPLDLAEVVTGALTLTRAALSSNIQLEAKIDDVGTVLADRTQVHQVLLNLCSNARDAVQPGGHITITLERLAAKARLRVKDDGAGMDEAIRARLFEPYLTTKPNGHGLGLAVVHGIVAGLGGTIHVESTPGHGTCFDVFLPLVETQVTPAASLSNVSAQERLLLVDDQPLVRAGLCRLLQSMGYRVTEASDGQDALERLRAAPQDFDLVISDQMMPRLSGLELARALRADGSRMPIILCSGFSEALDEENAMKWGVSGVLAKPIDRTSMATAVRRALG